MADSLLRHKLLPEAEGYIADRLSKASEFCDVPEDWDVQPLKNKIQGKGGEEDDGSDDDPEGSTSTVKRIHGSLNEDQLSNIWESAFDWCNEQFQNVYQDEGKSEDEDEDEMEDVVTNSADDKAKATGKAPESQAQSTQPDLPALPLGTMLKYMSTGGV